MTAIADRVVSRLPARSRSVVRRLRDEDVLLLSAGLAFYALVSVGPFAVLVLWLISLLTGDARVEAVAQRLAHFAPPALNVEGAFTRVATVGTSLGLGSVVAILWPATAYGGGLARAFDRLCPGEERPAKGLRGRALALALVGVMPGLAVAGLVASYAGTAVLDDGLAATVAGWLLALVFGFVATLGSVALIYRLFAPRPVPTGGLIRGAAVAATSISLVSLGYVIFLNAGANFEDRYATSGLASLILLALWLYLANALILAGYQVAQEAGH